jgi:hypothetical protein
VFPVPHGRTHTVPLKNRFQAFAENEGYKSTDNFERPCQIPTRRANNTRPPNNYKRTLNTEQVAPKTHNKAHVWPGNIFPAAKISRQYFDTRMSLHQLERDLDKQTKCLGSLKTKLTQTLLGQALLNDISDSTLRFKNRITSDLDEIIHEVSFFRKAFYVTKLDNLKTEFCKLHARFSTDEQNMFKTNFVQWGIQFIKGRRLFNSAKALYQDWFNELLHFDQERFIGASTSQANPDLITIENSSASSLDMFESTTAELPIIVQDSSSTSSLDTSTEMAKIRNSNAPGMNDEIDTDISITELNEIRAALRQTPIVKRRKMVSHTRKRPMKKSKSVSSTPKINAMVTHNESENEESIQQTEIIHHTGTAAYNIEQAIHQPSSLFLSNEFSNRHTRS